MVHVAAPTVSSVSAQPVPAELEALVARCLAKAPDDRPASAAEVAAVLDDMLVALPWTNLQARAWWEQRAAE